MCKAFSGICDRSGKVYWKFAVDSHENIKEKFNLVLKDKEKSDLCPFEIAPKNGDYLNPDEWVFKFDETCPDWWKASHEKHCWEAYKEWKVKLDKKIIHKKIIHPFKDIKEVTEITIKQKSLLKKWASVRDLVGASVWASVWDSVRDSVGASVWDSVWDSVRDSVGASVWDSVRDSVGASVWDSVWASVGAYIGSFFVLKKSEWKYTKKVKCKGYPFQPCVDLWEQGLVPSFDGSTWRLHSGEKAKIVFEIKATELRKLKVK